jgi:hypothetical protein
MNDTAKIIPLPERAPPADNDLVRKCVDCGAALAASAASYGIDPDGNSAHADVVASKYDAKASRGQQHQPTAYRRKRGSDWR